VFIRPALVAAALVGLSLLAPAVAVADPNAQGFYDMLELSGIPSERSAEQRAASLQFGYSICNWYAATLDNRQVMMWFYNHGYTPRDAAVWTVTSVNYLCPQYQYLLGH
jgi:hypothetical protein